MTVAGNILPRVFQNSVAVLYAIINKNGNHKNGMIAILANDSPKQQQVWVCERLKN